MKKEKKNCPPCKKTSIGGQALLEGVMMRGPERYALAVRRPNGEIFFETHENTQKKRAKICRWPFIRGIFGFIDSLTLGYKCLMRSAEIFAEEEENNVGKKADAEAAAEATEAHETAPVEAVQTEETPAQKEEKNDEPKSSLGKGAMTAVGIIAAVLGIIIVLGLFVWLPTFLFTKLSPVLPERVASSRLARSAFEGVIKIVLFVLYLLLVSLMKDIRRTFMYHGAEHKTIFCYEHGLPLTVENVRVQRRFHPRCGTSFLILMLIVSIIVGLFIPTSIAGVNPTAYTFIRAGIRLLLIPIIMGIGYELLKLAGRHDNVLTRIISAPGLWLQRITVKEPTDDMIECAIRSFEAVVPQDGSDKW